MKWNDSGVWKWMSKYIPQKSMNEITYPCKEYMSKLIFVSNRASGKKVFTANWPWVLSKNLCTEILKFCIVLFAQCDFLCARIISKSLHRIWQSCCRAVRKVAKWIVKWSECYGWRNVLRFKINPSGTEVATSPFKLGYGSVITSHRKPWM